MKHTPGPKPSGACLHCWNRGLHITCSPNGECPRCRREGRYATEQRGNGFDAISFTARAAIAKATGEA